MRIFLPVYLIVFACSCHNTTTHTTASDSISGSVAVTTSATPTPDYTRLLEKFPLTSFDTLEVNSPNTEENTSAFMGVTLDSSFYPLLKEINAFNGIYAISKFIMDNDNTGLLVRAGGEYDASAIYLFVYNRPANSLHLSGGMLADTWGDAGDSETSSSWLMYKQGQPLLKLLRREEGHDHSVENEQDTTYESSTDYYLMKVGFKGEDTVSKDNEGLLQNYRHLLKPGE